MAAHDLTRHRTVWNFHAATDATWTYLGINGHVSNRNSRYSSGRYLPSNNDLMSEEVADAKLELFKS